MTEKLNPFVPDGVGEVLASHAQLVRKGTFFGNLVVLEVSLKAVSDGRPRIAEGPADRPAKRLDGSIGLAHCSIGPFGRLTIHDFPILVRSNWCRFQNKAQQLTQHPHNCPRFTEQ